VLRLELTAVGNDDGLGGLSVAGTDGLDGLDNVHTLADLSEDAVLTIEPLGLDGAQKELGSVGVGTSVGHGKDTRSSVLELEVLISELVSVDGLATGSVSDGEITTLAHELRDDTMEDGTLKVEGLAGLAHTLLTGAEASEVLNGLGDHIGAELHNDASGGLTTDGHIEENLGVGHLDGFVEQVNCFK